MVSPTEGKKALGVCRGLEQGGGMSYGHGAVARGMHDEQRFVQIAHLLQHALFGGIVQKLLLDAENPPFQVDLGLSRILDRGYTRIAVLGFSSLSALVLIVRELL